MFIEKIEYHWAPNLYFIYLKNQKQYTYIKYNGMVQYERKIRKHK